MNIQKILATVAILGTITSSNAMKIEHYKRGWQGPHIAYCFDKSLAARFRPWVDGAADLAPLVGLIPGVGTCAARIITALAKIGKHSFAHTTVGWSTGFALHVPNGGIGVPFLWEWDTGKAVY